MSRKTEVKAFISCVAQDADIPPTENDLPEMVYNCLNRRDAIRKTSLISDLLKSIDSGSSTEEASRIIRIELSIFKNLV